MMMMMKLLKRQLRILDTSPICPNSSSEKPHQPSHSKKVLTIANDDDDNDDQGDFYDDEEEDIGEKAHQLSTLGKGFAYIKF